MSSKPLGIMSADKKRWSSHLTQPNRLTPPFQYRRLFGEERTPFICTLNAIKAPSSHLSYPSTRDVPHLSTRDVTHLLTRYLNRSLTTSASPSPSPPQKPSYSSPTPPQTLLVPFSHSLQTALHSPLRSSCGFSATRRIELLFWLLV